MVIPASHDVIVVHLRILRWKVPARKTYATLCISNEKHFNKESKVLNNVQKVCRNKGQGSLQQDYQPEALKRVVFKSFPGSCSKEAQICLQLPLENSGFSFSTFQIPSNCLLLFNLELFKEEILKTIVPGSFPEILEESDSDFGLPKDSLEQVVVVVIVKKKKDSLALVIR